ncbi:MAG: four helix bundle protein [bacterium]
MAQFQHLPLYYKFYQLTKYLYERTKNFPRHYKYTLGQLIVDLSWNCVDLLVEANSSFKEEKYKKILELSVMYDRLKIRLRLAQEIGLISEKQFVHIQLNYSKEIGKMIGGWLKWSEANR